MIVQQVLFDTTTIPVKERPRPVTRDFIEQVADKLMSSGVAQWLNADGEDEKPDLVEALEGEWREWDGVRLCLWLEKYHGWGDANMELAEILDQASSIAYGIVRTAVSEWVLEQGIVPSFGVGDAVTYKEYVGEVVAIDTKHGEYTIFVEAMGHIRKGSGSGTLGTFVPFEKLV